MLNNQTTEGLALRLADVFSKENDKLGRIYSFSLPAITTCPGSSGLCRELCYATRRRSRFQLSSVKDAYERNYTLSKRRDFHRIVADLLERARRDRPVVRLHVSGDFYDSSYTWKWLQVVKRSRRVRFLAYTRSWSVPAIAEVLQELAACPNFYLWYSADRETGLPRSKPAAVRVAWMQTRHGEARRGAALYFRDHDLRNELVKSVAGTLVCPVENGATHTTCDRCQVCFTDPKEDPTKRTRGRMALQLA